MRRQRTEQKSLTTGYVCNCNAKEIIILFCKQIGQSPNTSYANCRMGLKENGNGGERLQFPPYFCVSNSLQAGGRPDKIAIRQGQGTLLVSARTQKSRFEDLEWGSVTVMSSQLRKSRIGVIPIICQGISVRRPFFIIANFYHVPTNFLFLFWEIR